MPADMASAESDEDPSRMAGEEPHLALPAQTFNPAFEPTNIKSRE